MQSTAVRILALAFFGLLCACDSQERENAGVTRSGTIERAALNEASGMQSGTLNRGVYYLHNDDGRAVIYAMDSSGRDLGRFKLAGARNRDWEDITSAPSAAGPLLVIADTGDKMARWKNVTLYFFLEPQPGTDNRFSGSVDLLHKVHLRYPDGPRDCESLSYDPASGDLLFITKRDNPPRIYRISLKEALSGDEADLQFAGETIHFRPPGSRDLAYFGKRDAIWVSQPTGFDINDDGSQAAVISYRSLYLFDRAAGEDWPAALAREPVEFEGPPSRKEEAVSYSPGGEFIMVTTEGVHAPVYRIRLLPEAD
jgi:hypothetical protein